MIISLYKKMGDINVINLDKRIKEHKNFNHFLLPNNFLKTVNQILENSIEQNKQINYTELMKKIKSLLDNGKMIYKEYGINDNNKIELIKIFLKNISLLLRSLNIRKIYNYNPKINIKDFANKSFGEQIENLVYSKNYSLDKQKVIGGNCNYWLVFLYNLIYKELTQEDNDLKILFQINFDTHGKMFVVFSNKVLIIEENKGIKFKEILKNDFKKYQNKYFFSQKNLNYSEYINIISNLINKKNKLIFIYNGKKISFFNFGGLCFIFFGDNVKFFTKTNFHKNLKFVGYKNLEDKQIKKFLYDLIGEENKIFLDIFFKNVNTSHLNKFFKK